jgi:hypothetical protein
LKDNEYKDLDSVSPQNVVHLIDRFIEQMLQTRKILTMTLSLSICSIIIAPIAIGLSIYLLQHPSFFALLERENELGLVLGGLLIAVIIVSSLWFVVGVKQYLSISSWNKKYSIYIFKEKRGTRQGYCL